MERSLGDYEQIQGMRKVVGIDRRVDSRVRRDYVHAAAGKGVFKNGEHGEVVPRIRGRIWDKKGTGITDELGSETSRQEDLLRAGLVWVEELLEDKLRFLKLIGGGV